MFRKNRRFIYLLVLLLALALAVATGSSAAGAQPPQPSTPDAVDDVHGAIIDNGTVQLGVNQEGHLIARTLTDPTDVGLVYLPEGNEALAIGWYAQSWGLGDPNSGLSGWASPDSWNGSTANLVSFDSDSATYATSETEIGSELFVTHDYQPSSNPYLYEVEVTVERIGSAGPLVYRQVMDWDVEPTPREEFVTIQGTEGISPEVIFASDDGWAHPDPLVPAGDLGYTYDFTDGNGGDHGAVFDFDLGYFADGEAKSFTLYFGAAGTELDALEALAEVGADVYSLAQPDTPKGPLMGEPNTFIFGSSFMHDGDPFLWLDKPATFVPSGGNTTVDLMIRDVSDLYGIELEMEFDPSLVQVVDADPLMSGIQIAAGDCPEADFTAANYADNGSGYIVYSVSSLNPTPACSGPGLVAQITFNGHFTEWTSPLRFMSLLLADSNGMPMPYGAMNGMLPVVTGGIFGQVQLQGRTSHQDVSVCAEHVTGWPRVCDWTGPDGSYFLYPMADGDYDVWADMLLYLETETLAVPVTTGTMTTLPDVTMLGGDANEDDVVNILDLSLIGSNYGGWDWWADINADGMVNIQDIVIAGSNYLKHTPTPWP